MVSIRVNCARKYLSTPLQSELTYPWRTSSTSGRTTTPPNATGQGWAELGGQFQPRGGES